MSVANILDSKGHIAVTVRSTCRIGEAAAIMHGHKIGAVVVSDNGLVLRGIISERDIVVAVVDRGPSVLEDSVQTVMTSDVQTCAPDDDLRELMEKMTNHRIRHLPVLKNGILAGLVSIGDVVKYRIEEVEAEAHHLKEFILEAA